MPRYRWRTEVRSRLPWPLVDLGVAAKGRRDCGNHEWYRHDDDEDRCYHCVVGVRRPSRFVRGTRWTMAVGPEAVELLDEIAAEMTRMARITVDEAVARINAHWRGQNLSAEDDVIHHETADFWAARIYYEHVPDWSPAADRTTWPVRPAPGRD